MFRISSRRLVGGLLSVVLAGLLLACGGSDDRKRSRRSRDATESTPVGGAVVAKPTTFKAKLYLESSGSMFPYDAPGGSGEFNQAMQELLGRFETQSAGSTRFFAVNDDVYPLGVDYDKLVKTPDVFALTKGKGTPNYTDFGAIFSRILTDLNEGEVALLFSDLVYSAPYTAAQSTSKALADVKALMQSAFNPHANRSSLLLLQLNSGFDGPYYFATSGNAKSIRHQGERPYYIAVLARPVTMRALLSDPKSATLRDFGSLSGFQTAHHFVGAEGVAPYFSVILKDPAQKGRFVQEHDEKVAKKGWVHSLENVEADNSSGGLTLALGADLNGLYLPETFKTSPASYEIESKDGFKLTKVEAVSGQAYSHKLILTTPKPSKGQRTLTVRLKRTFPPAWIRTASTDTDRNLSQDQFASTTFGLRALTGGIEAAYNPDGKTSYFPLSLTLNN